MGYYADAERHYDPETTGRVSRWTKRNKMTVDDIKQILANFVEQVTTGGKDYKWCSGEFGAPIELRLDHPGTPVYDGARISLADQPGYGEESVLRIQLAAYSNRYYLVDLTDVEKLQKQLEEIADDTYDRLEEWDDEQASYDPEEDPFEDEEEDFFDKADREYDKAKDEGALD